MCTVSSEGVRGARIESSSSSSLCAIAHLHTHKHAQCQCKGVVEMLEGSRVCSLARNRDTWMVELDNLHSVYWVLQRFRFEMRLIIFMYSWRGIALSRPYFSFYAISAFTNKRETFLCVRGHIHHEIKYHAYNECTRICIHTYLYI